MKPAEENRGRRNTTFKPPGLWDFQNAAHTLECGGMTIVFREVPALVCENCGGAFHDEGVTASLLKQAEQAAAAGVEIDVRPFTVAE